MIGLRDFQQYINFMIEAGSKAEEVIDVPSDYPDYIRAGNEYADLVKQRGWKRLLDDLELRANQRLAKLRESDSLDPVVIKALRDQWVEAEDSLKFIQIRTAEAIDRRRSILNDLGERFGGLDIADGQDQKIRDFMGMGSGVDDLEDLTFNHAGVEQ